MHPMLQCRPVEKALVCAGGSVALIGSLPPEHNWPAACSWMFVCAMSWPWIWTGRAWNDYAWKLREDGIRVIGWALTLTLGLSTVAHVATFIWMWANGSDGLTSFYRDRYGDLSGSFRAMFVGDMAPLGYLMFAMVSVWGWSTSVSWRKASAPIDWVSAGRTEEIDYEVVLPRPTDLLRLSDRSSRK